MSPNGRRAWRVAAKKLRRKIGRRVRDLDHRSTPISGAWFRRHGFTMDDPRYQIRQYIGTWGTVDGDGVEFAIKPASFTPRSLVGMTQGARKRAAWYEALRSSYDGDGGPISNRKLRLCNRRSVLTVMVLAVTVPIEWRLKVRAKYRIGQNLRPCAGCIRCECQTAFDVWPKLGEALAKDLPTCDGSGVLTARKENQ